MLNREQINDLRWFQTHFSYLYGKYGAGWVIIRDKRVRAVCKDYLCGVNFAEEFLGYTRNEYIVQELAENINDTILYTF